jgi:biopolymer transport protein ExbD
MSGGKKTFLKRRKLGEDMTLQITSMADIFMILLVFLLKSYSTSLATVSLTEGTQLPTATAGGAMRDALKLEVTDKAVNLDSRSVAKLENFRFQRGDVDASGTARAIVKALSDWRAKTKTEASVSNLVVVADQRVPYATLKPILASAAGVGYVDLQLVVVEKD